MTDLLWHYTPRYQSHLGKILRDGVIKREGETGRPTNLKLKYYIPGVWFSANQMFEPTAVKRTVEKGKHRPLTVIESLPISARLGVTKETLCSWHEYKYRSLVMLNLTPKHRKIAVRYLHSLEEVGMKNGADPADWFMSFDPVPLARCKAFQIYHEGAWQDVELVKQESLVSQEAA